MLFDTGGNKDIFLPFRNDIYLYISQPFCLSVTLNFTRITLYTIGHFVRGTGKQTKLT